MQYLLLGIQRVRVRVRAAPKPEPRPGGLDTRASAPVRRKHPNRLGLIRPPAGILLRLRPSATVAGPLRRAIHDFGSGHIGINHDPANSASDVTVAITSVGGV